MNAMKKTLTTAGILAAIILGGCIGQPVGEYPILTDLFGGNLSVEGEPVLNRTVTLIFSVKPLMDMNNTKMRITLSDCIEHHDGTLEWDGGMKKGEDVIWTNIIKNVCEGEVELRAQIGSFDESGRLSQYRGYHVFLHSTQKGAFVTSKP